MRNTRKFALTALLAVLALSLAGCAGDYYYQGYDEVDVYGDICIYPEPPCLPGPGGPVVVGGQEPPRHTPLPKPAVQPAPRTKEPDREPRTPAPRTPKPRNGGGARATKTGQVRR
jgi:hypothetical protein